MPMHLVYILVMISGVASYAMGFAMGYGFGRRNGYMIGEELERRKWKRREEAAILGMTPEEWARERSIAEQLNRAAP